MLAVLIYQFVSNKPAGMPDAWPAEVKETSELPNENWLLMTEQEFVAYKSTHQAAYNAWYASTIPAPNPLNTYIAIVSKAKEFANEIMNIAAAENILMGITQVGKTKLIADTLRDVTYYLQSGSLYEAMTSIDAVVITAEMAPFITSSRLLEFKNKIRVYLGLPPL